MTPDEAIAIIRSEADQPMARLCAAAGVLAAAYQRAARVAALWSSPYVPHSDVDWARYHLAERWPVLREALDDLVLMTRTVREPGPAVVIGGTGSVERAVVCGALDLDPETGRDRMCVQRLDDYDDTDQAACPLYGPRLAPVTTGGK